MIRHSEDIRTQAEASVIGGRWRRRGRSQEDDHGLTFEINEFSMREPNLVEIGLAVFEKRSYGRTHRQTDRQTDRQTPLLYIYIYIDIDTTVFSRNITPWAYRKETLFPGRILGHGRYFGPKRIHGCKMLSFDQSSSKHLMTAIPQMLAIIHLQDQRYWYPYSISIHAETTLHKQTGVVGLKSVKSIRIGNCNEDMSLAVSTFTQH